MTVLVRIVSAIDNSLTPDLVWVFERGFLDRKRRSGGLHVFPFARCRFYRNSIRHYADGAVRYTSYQYVVRRDDGETGDLYGESQLSGWVQVLGETIAAAISAIQAARPSVADRASTSTRSSLTPSGAP